MKKGVSIPRKCHNYYKYGNFREGFIFAKLRILFSLNYAAVKTFVHLAWSSVYHSRRTIAAQWLSGRVLDSRPKGRGFEPHRRHCVVVLEQDTFILA